MKYYDKGYRPGTRETCSVCGRQGVGRHAWSPHRQSMTFDVYYPIGTLFTCPGRCTDAFAVEQALLNRDQDERDKRSARALGAQLRSMHRLGMAAGEALNRVVKDKLK